MMETTSGAYSIWKVLFWNSIHSAACFTKPSSATVIFQKPLLELLFAKIYIRLKYPYNPERQKKNPSWEFWAIFSYDHYLSPSTKEFCLFQSVCDPFGAWRRRANSFPNFGSMYLVRNFYYVSVNISLRWGLHWPEGMEGGSFSHWGAVRQNTPYFLLPWKDSFLQKEELASLYYVKLLPTGHFVWIILQHLFSSLSQPLEIWFVKDTCKLQ